MSETYFKTIVDGILSLKKNEVLSAVDEALAKGVDPYALVEHGLTGGMREMGERFEAGQVYIPHLMVASEIVESAMKTLTPHLQASQETKQRKPIAVIGTVEGDIHDLGKNLVSTMLTCNGIQVIDLGRDVPAVKFVDTIRENQADFVMLSALMTTTMMNQQKVIEALKSAGVRETVKIYVGGAPVSREWATRIGADGYGIDAMEAVKLVRQAL